MPKYTVGDVAALFPKRTPPKTESGEKLKSLFNEFYSKSNKKQFKNTNQTPMKKQGVKDASYENPDNSNLSESKKKKRKFQDIADSTANLKSNAKKQRKLKFDVQENEKKSIHPVTQNKAQEEETYFPRNKKKRNAKKQANSDIDEFDESDIETDFDFSGSVETGKNKKKKQSEMQFVDGADSNKKGKKKKKNKKPQNGKLGEKKESKEIKVETESASDNLFGESIESEELSDLEDEKMDNKVQEEIKKKLEKKLGKKTSKGAPAETNERLARTLFVGNLPVTTTRSSLEKLFSPFGQIICCRVRGAVPVKETIPKKIAEIKHKFHPRLHNLIGYVVFAQIKDAEQAIILNGTLVDDHHIVVNFAAGQNKEYDDNRSVFIGNLPFDVQNDVVWSTFSQCGEVEAVRIIRDRETGAGKGFGYVLFKKIQSKDNALALNNLEIDGRQIRIKAVEKTKSKYQSKKSRNGARIDNHHTVAKSTAENHFNEKFSVFVRNLPFVIEDGVIRSAFSQCGEVEAINIIKNKKTGRGKGYGYVLFKKIQSKANALALTNMEIGGRQIQIKESGSIKSKYPEKKQVMTLQNAKRNALSAMRRKAKDSRESLGGHKSLKKIMKKQKMKHDKQKVANVFKKFPLLGSK